jgi:rfaE bifunctional protein nucleotidyltransferase chain/domain
VLIVGINSDNCTRRLKGEGRPINHERERMALVAALDAVDYVLLFDEDTPIELIRALRPHIHVKGGDYTAQELPEAEAVHAGGGRIVILPIEEGKSTSNTIARIAAMTAQISVAQNSAYSEQRSGGMR